MNQEVKRRIEIVLFDAAGTLFDVRGSVGEIYARVAGRYGVQADPAAVQEEFVRAFRARAARGVITRGAADPVSAERRWWKDVVAAVFAERMEESVLNRYFEEVFEAFRRADAWVLFPDTPACLDRLRSEGYRLGVLSNFDSRLLDLLAGLRLSPWFETVTLSWRAGAAKPEPEIFLQACASMRAEARQAAYVGDSLRDDYEGAAKAGLLPVLLDRRRKHAAREGLNRIESLAELPGLLGGDLRAPGP